jgi:hypothetical protein
VLRLHDNRLIGPDDTEVVGRRSKPVLQHLAETPGIVWLAAALPKRPGR